MAMNSENASVKRTRSPVPMVHSANEDGNDHIQVTEKPLQFYNNQILIKLGNVDEYELVETLGKKRHVLIYTYQDSDIVQRVMAIIHNTQNVAIYCEIEPTYLPESSGGSN